LSGAGLRGRLTPAPRTIAVNGAFALQPVSGVQRYAGELLRALAAGAGERLRFAAIVPRPGPGLAATLDGCEVIAGRSRLPAALWTQARLPALVRRSGAALLWSPANAGPLAVRDQAVTIQDAAVFAGPEWFSRRFALYYRALLPRLGARVRRVITSSEFSKRELARHGIAPAERIAVVPGGVSARFHPGAEGGRWVEKRPYVLALGGGDPRKNVTALLRAWPLVARQPGAPAGLKLLVAGAGSRALRRGGSLPAVEGVEFLGRVADEDLPGLYASGEAFAYPSLYEGFGLPPLEAMACGTPVLAADRASLPEVCGPAALYANPLEVEGIAAGLAALVTDAGLRARLREAGLARAALFTWERAAARMAEVLEDVVG
jgi:glycosyltransferase involved in cell wall biosynthesis